VSDAAAPAIFASRADARRESTLGRVIALLVALGCLVVLILAATLPPSPSGMGTHLSMGMGRCGFLERTGLPCPSCGMTTSFAWFTRGNLLASFYVQPMGAVIAIGAALTVWGGLYVAMTGRPVYRLFRLLPGRYGFLCLMMFAILAWGWKILIHLNGWDGWRTI
jgi:hypothetical protein